MPGERHRKPAAGRRGVPIASLRALVEQADEVVFRYRLQPSPAFEYLSDAVTGMVGYTPAEHYADPDLGRRMVHPDDRGKLDEHVRAARSPEPLEIRWIHRDGRTVWTEQRQRPVRDAGGRVVAVDGIARDVTGARADQALRESEARYRTLVHNAVTGIFRSDRAGRFLVVNPALAAMLGYASEAELLAADALREVWVDPRHWQSLAQRPGDGRIRGVEIPWRRKDGSAITVRLSGRVVLGEAGAAGGLEVVVEDVTGRHLREEQMRHAHTMEAIGRLAGGVAHDFNNILTAITGYAELLRADLAGDHAGRHDLEQIRRAADRAAALTRQLLAFGRRQRLAPRVLDLAELVQGMRRVLERLLGPAIALALAATPGVRRRVRADPSQLGRVLKRLAAHARDAMPRGGCLRIECTDVRIGDRPAHPPMAPGDYVLLTVADDGAGLDEATRAHLFEPFFAVRPGRPDTGLGLATVYGIVTQSGGHVFVDSEPGHGTCFRIYLPAFAGAPEVVPEAEPRARRRGGDETVLLVEDEEPVRRIARLTLEQRGYRVLEADAPAAALRIADAQTGPIHLMVTDMFMPGMSGSQLAAALAAVRPGLPVLYMSGYPGHAEPHSLPAESAAPFLAKPFTPDELARKVRETMDGGVTRGAPRTEAEDEAGG